MAWWKKLLYPQPWLVVLLSLVCGTGLIWVFSSGMDNSWFAYLLYPVSAYALTTAVAWLVKCFPVLKLQWQARTRKKEESAFGLGFYGEQIVNFCYGGFKLAWGTVAGSAWIGADGLYNFTQGIIQLYQLLAHRRTPDIRRQWKAYRNCGYMMIFVNLTMTGMAFQMIQMGRHEDNSEIAIIGTAAFTFYKLVKAIIEMAKDRKHKNPVDSAVYFLDFGQALYNLFVLQVGLLWTFGGAEYPYQYLMNSLTGTAVCILVCGIGIYMLWRSKRDMKALQA